VLVAIADDEVHLRAIFDLDAATNDRLLAEHQRWPGIGIEELVFAVPHATVVNAAFCHPNPLGSRFGSPDRGAWYAGFDLATSQAEVAFHKSVQLAEIGRFDDSVTYDDYLADFTAPFHDLRTTGQGLPRPRQLRRIADAGRTAARHRLARRRLSKRSTRRRHLPRLLPSGARRQRAPPPDVPVHLDRPAGTDDRNRARRRGLDGIGLHAPKTAPRSGDQAMPRRACGGFSGGIGFTAPVPLSTARSLTQPDDNAALERRLSSRRASVGVAGSPPVARPAQDICGPHLADLSDQQILDRPALIRELADYIGSEHTDAVAANTAILAKAAELGELRFAQKASVHQLLREYRILGSVLGQFVNEVCETGPEPASPLDGVLVLNRLHGTVHAANDGETFVSRYRADRRTDDAARGLQRMVSHELRQR
jgi:hypothetical protein